MIFLGNSHKLLKQRQFCYQCCKLCLTTSRKMSIKTFVFLDLETTGLPHLEHNRTKITELCAVAVQADHIELGCFPRVHNKLSFCLNPQKMISIVSSEITGLSNDMLEHQTCFSSEVVNIMNKWLDMNKKPICLVAHNGNRFDYPIFRAEIEKTGENLMDDVLCVDSLNAFRHIDNSDSVTETCTSTTSKNEPKKVPFEFDDEYDKILCEAAEQVEHEELEKQVCDTNLSPEQKQKENETTPKKQMISAKTIEANPNGVKKFSKKVFGSSSFSYKLSDVYTRLTSKEPIKAHEAEGDVTMLIACAASYGEKFVDYANNHSVAFASVRPMKPGAVIR